MNKREIEKFLEGLKLQAVAEINNEFKKKVNAVKVMYAVKVNIEKELKNVTSHLEMAKASMKVADKKIDIEDHRWSTDFVRELDDLIASVKDPMTYIDNYKNITDYANEKANYNLKTQAEAETRKNYNIMIQNAKSFTKVVDAIAYLKELGIVFEEEGVKTGNLPISPLDTRYIICKGETEHGTEESI